MARVGPAARALGFAGLLPQMATVLGLVLLRVDGREWLWAVSSVAILYAVVILSFLGGMWWSMAMRRDAGQARLAAVAVLPSLCAMGLLMASEASYVRDWGLVAIGSAIILTLPVDRHLSRTGEAPEGWMRLRVPLSLGLGMLTILAGALYGSA